MKHIVISSYKSQYPNPIGFQSGDHVEIGKRDDEFPGWVWVTTSDGNQGWAPSESLNFTNDGQKAIANHSYSARELNTKKGELLTLLFELAGWGWVVNEHNESGWVLLNTIKRVW
jgi:hypothetical protein